MTDQPYCGVVGTCGRWAGHRGHHGGFRPVPRVPGQDSPVVVPRFHSFGLAPREVEVLLTLTEGVTGKEAGHQLGISEQTIKNHLRNAYRKLDVTSLVGAFHVLGWIRISPEEAALRMTEAALLGDVTDVLEVLAGITGRLDAARDVLTSGESIERRETA